ncbi:MAG: MFS transporter [Actinobacteria bacterium]|nr:MFS transporter [Actinomycetota bacterium]NBP17161.1 MFS transporter [Actinomycetota bacterium]NBY57234.1 MFS transporter [Actinomycetota bacterium]NCY09148.1 MFS transporter [Actinomycetota bacterium]NDC47094.1 MFS transporter [Actinomycetota bacterium]
MSDANERRLPGVFWRHLSASSISNLGDGMVAAAGPLLALTLTNDVRLISLVSFASMIPWLVLSLPLGVVIDRVERRRLLTLSTAARGALYGIVTLLIISEQLNIGLLIALVTLIAVFEVVFDMSAQAFLPSLVEPEHLERANGRLYATEVIANSFVGLPIGAVLFATAAFTPFGVQTIALVVAALLILGLRPRTPFVPVAHERASLWVEMRTGLRWLAEHRLLRLLAVLLGLVNMAHMFAASVFAKFARDVLDVGPRGFGLLLAVSAGGAIVGGLIGDRVAKMLGPAMALVISYGMFAVLDLLPGIFPNVAVVVVSGTLMSVFGTTWNVITVSLRQRLIPPELFGRVNSVYRFLGTGSTSIGALIGGQLAYRYGLRATYLVSGVLLICVLAVATPALLRYGRIYMAPERTPAPPSIT